LGSEKREVFEIFWRLGKVLAIPVGLALVGQACPQRVLRWVRWSKISLYSIESVVYNAIVAEISAVSPQISPPTPRIRFRFPERH
jgi:hypothetical protein